MTDWRSRTDGAHGRTGPGPGAWPPQETTTTTTTRTEKRASERGEKAALQSGSCLHNSGGGALDNMEGDRSKAPPTLLSISKSV